MVSPVLICQHMPPVFTHLFAERLSHIAGRVVKEASDGEAIFPSHIYVAPGGCQMRVFMLEGKRPRIFGTGEQVRDYLYVMDVVEANELALALGSGEMVNLGTGIGTSVNDIFRELKAIVGFTGEPVYEAPRPGEVQRIYLDATRAKQVLGWTPQVSFRDGLARTVEWSRPPSSAPILSRETSVSSRIRNIAI